MRDLIEGIPFDRTVDDSGWTIQFFAEGWISDKAFRELCRLYALDWVPSMEQDYFTDEDWTPDLERVWLRRAPAKEFYSDGEGCWSWILDISKSKPPNHLAAGWFRGTILDLY